MALPPWAPPPEAVAPHLREYLKDEGSGAFLEEFGAATTIPVDEVFRAIASVVADIGAAVGEVPEILHEYAASVAAIGAAAEAVVDRDIPLHQALQELYEVRLGRLTTAVAEADDGTVSAGTRRPASGSFPAPFCVSQEAF